MANPLGPEKALVFRLTHRSNVQWILQHGLHCANSEMRDPDFVTIGKPDLIVERSPRPVPVGPGGTLHDYVPFYFTPYSIMLYNIVTGFNVRQHAPEDLVVLVSSLFRLREHGVQFVFTDRHAYPVSAKFFTSLTDLTEVDWELLRSRDFQHDPEDPGKKERYQAEALAYAHVPVDALIGMVCYSDDILENLSHQCSERNIAMTLKVRPNWFFTP